MRFLIRIFSLLSLKSLYRLSDYFLFPLMYHIIRYRRKLAYKNIRLSFPEKSKDEIDDIERRFYHHLSDVIVEIIWSYRATDEEMCERMQFENVADMEHWAQEKQGVFFMLGHFGNWEWTADIQKRYTNPDMQHYNVYRRLKNKSADQTMLELREKRSGKGSCIEKNNILRHLITIRKTGKPFSLGLISDQKVQPQNAYYWTDFFHRNTSFLGGGEVLATKFDWAVTYVHIRQAERGKYIARVDLIEDSPKQASQYSITEKFARALENNIQEQPELWLWTHNRWKWSENTSR